MKEILIMSYRETERLKVISRIEFDELTVVDAAESIHISERQMYRILKRYHTEGEAGLLHRLRGRMSKSLSPKTSVNACCVCTVNGTRTMVPRSSRKSSMNIMTFKFLIKRQLAGSSKLDSGPVRARNDPIAKNETDAPVSALSSNSMEATTLGSKIADPCAVFWSPSTMHQAASSSASFHPKTPCMFYPSGKSISSASASLPLFIPTSAPYTTMIKKNSLLRNTVELWRSWRFNASMPIHLRPRAESSVLTEPSRIVCSRLSANKTSLLSTRPTVSSTPGSWIALTSASLLLIPSRISTDPLQALISPVSFASKPADTCTTIGRSHGTPNSFNSFPPMPPCLRLAPKSLYVNGSTALCMSSGMTMNSRSHCLKQKTNLNLLKSV